MSKSRGNVINPLIMAEKFGTDTLRLYLMFMGPYDSTMVWNTEGIEGMRRFIDKLWKLFQQKNSEFNPEDEKTLNIKLQQTIKKITEDIEQFKYNTAIAQLMILVNFFKENGVTNQAKKVLCQLIAPFAPYFAEEVWVNILNQDFSVHKQNWPQFNKNILSGSKKTIVVQVNGKVRDQIGLTQEGSENQKEVERVVQNSPKSIKWLQGKKLRKTVFVAGKLINFVVD
jgi:leucyl-tRNA synthetase